MFEKSCTINEAGEDMLPAYEQVDPELLFVPAPTPQLVTVRFVSR
jgi:hypothetical protein